LTTAIRTLVRYRPLIQSLVSRELKARYRGSVLGFLWSFVNPLLLLATYGLVFTYMLPVRKSPAVEPYFLFLFCGILPWTWFSACLAESAGVLISSGNLIKKVLFPAEVLPTVTVLANLAHFLLGLPILLAFLVWKGKLAWTAVLLPLPILVQLVLSLGLALFLSALTVHFRDLQSILGHILHLWFFATPILYDYAEVHGRLRSALRLNPMTHVLVTYQQMLFHGNVDHWRGLCLTLLVGILAFAVGAFLFDRLRDTYAEEV
jgi:ABC-type polysaccharide/polyol phosphate export permease